MNRPDLRPVWSASPCRDRGIVRPLATALALLAGLASVAPAQQDARSRLRPIAAGLRDAGVLHLASGTWTRGPPALDAVAGEAIVYANTCPTGYFAAMYQGERFTDEGSLPSAAMPLTASTQIPGAYDTAPGTASWYEINGFEIAYCTSSAVFGAQIAFHSGYQPATSLCAPVPSAPAASFALTGLPASDGVTSACWTVAFDLEGSSAAFALAATDGAGDANAFGWSFSLLHAPVAPNSDGPVIAGGLAVQGSYAGCSGTDATRWDVGTASVAWPGNVVQQGAFPEAQEPGTGMLTQDAFRVEPQKWPSLPNCYYFGGNPLASFRLELYADVGGCSPEIGTSLCLPGQGGVIACPCGNAPANPGAGCDNSGAGQPATGGARLTAVSFACTGAGSISDDDVTLSASDVRASTTSIFLQGDQVVPAGVAFGDGVRCAGGQLLRLNSPGGTSSNAWGNVAYPNASSSQPITQRVAALGAPIAAGDSRWYALYYRDPSPTFCPAPIGGTWNVTQTVQLAWGP